MELATCPACGAEMQYVHEHDACRSCGLIIGCCEGIARDVPRKEDATHGR